MGKSIANKQLTLQKRRWSTRHQSRHDCMCSHSKPLVAIGPFVGAVVNDRISGQPTHRNRADTGRRTCRAVEECHNKGGTQNTSHAY